MKFIRNNSRILNRVLYGVLSLKFTSYEDASRAIGVSCGVLTHAVINGCIPRENNASLICSFFKIPFHVLFNSSDIAKRKEVALSNGGVIERHSFDYQYPIKGDVSVYGGIGVKKPRFRNASFNSVKHPVLYGVLIAENLTLSELAERIGVSSRRIIAYVYEGENASDDTLSKVEKVLDFDVSLLFLLVDGF